MQNTIADTSEVRRMGVSGGTRLMFTIELARLGQGVAQKRASSGRLAGEALGERRSWSCGRRRTVQRAGR